MRTLPLFAVVLLGCPPEIPPPDPLAACDAYQACTDAAPNQDQDWMGWAVENHEDCINRNDPEEDCAAQCQANLTTYSIQHPDSAACDPLPPLRTTQWTASAWPKPESTDAGRFDFTFVLTRVGPIGVELLIQQGDDGDERGLFCPLDSPTHFICTPARGDEGTTVVSGQLQPSGRVISGDLVLTRTDGTEAEWWYAGQLEE